MKTLWKSVKITIAFCVFFSVFYILVLWIFAQFAGPNKGNAEVLTLNGKAVGAANVGQMFTEDLYCYLPNCLHHNRHRHKKAVPKNKCLP